MDASLPILLSQYFYDSLDRLTSQGQPDACGPQFFYCASRLATEIQGAVCCSIVQQGDLVLAEQQHQGGASESTLLATDQQGSVLHLLKNNFPQRSIAYSPYGHHPNESGLTSLLGFNGERRDAVTGCYWLGNGYRAFNPVLMRFNSADNWSPFGRGGLNAYAYCQGNPVLRTDPTGHVAIIASKALNILPRTRKGTFLGFYVGRKAPLTSLKNGGTLSGAAMHAEGKLLGPGLYATSDEKVAQAFLNQAGPNSEVRMFGVHYVGELDVSQYGHGIHRNASLQTVAQSGSTYRVPNTQFDNLILTEQGSPAPAVRATPPTVRPRAALPSVSQVQRAQIASPPRAQAPGMNSSNRHQQGFNVIGPLQVRIRGLQGMTLEQLERLDL
ncbi:RHS repeat-associated core domain-containing protein [Pseudomonas sp. PSB11]|jgi:RHS repeat-associated protein|uniref:RHS repeat-associated core domain-containing protein n=1 Tax=Pseudomonas sp. PSB11 TaxID=2021969 RepID=UPI001660D393|nr:RHS repeat-associated core domain-containing protein [Pseudomonas sp. PSB11]MBD0680743.1 hypothetical protein [Pseudomonas sp. PSB11]